MKNLIPVILPFLLLSLTQFAKEKRDDSSKSFNWSIANSESHQAKYILNQIKQWQSQDRVDETKKLRVVYFYPKDRKPLKNYKKRWDKIMNDIQSFFSVEMEKLGYGKSQLSLEKENGLLKLHEVVGSAKDDGTYSYQSGGRILNEVTKALKTKGINAKEEKS